jgi:hypothetical protein
MPLGALSSGTTRSFGRFCLPEGSAIVLAGLWQAGDVLALKKMPWRATSAPG